MPKKQESKPTVVTMEMIHEDAVDEFVILVKKGVDCWVSAGELLGKMIASDPDCFAKIVKTAPFLSLDVLDSFVRMGNRQIHPYLVLDGRPASKRLARLPYDRQQKIYEMEVDVVQKKNGGTTKEKKRFCDLSDGEAALVLGETGIRTAEDQILILLKPRKKRAMINTRGAFSEADEDANEDGICDEAIPIIVRADAQLVHAQNALLNLRTILEDAKKNASFDTRITHALSAIGNLRFELKQAFPKPKKVEPNMIGVEA